MTLDDRLFLISEDQLLESFEDDEDLSLGVQSSSTPVKNNHSSQHLIYLACVSAALGGVLFGYDVGIIAGARGLVAKELILSCTEEELVVSIMPLGAVTASLISGWFLKILGRKFCIQLTALMFTLGACILGTANSLSVLLMGRFLVGFCVSLSAMSECFYMSEIASASSRGRLVTLNELGITFGFLFAFIINYMFITVQSGWRYMFGLSGVFSCVQFICMLFLPKTPHFLVTLNRSEEAVNIMKDMHGLGGLGARREVEKIKSIQREEKSTSCISLFSNEDNMRSRMIVGFGLVLAQQLTGQPNILYYASDIAQSVGFCGDILGAAATMLLGMIKVLATVLAMFVIDRFGRRILLLSGVSLMMMSLFCLIITSYYQEHSDGFGYHQPCADMMLELNNSTEISSSCPISSTPPFFRYLSFAALITYITSYSLSFGPITWVLLSELFPLTLKTHAMSLSQALNWAINVLVSVTFLDFVRVFKLPFVVSFYFLMSIISLAFIYFYVPETKNKTLEEICLDLRNTSSRNHKTLSPLPAVNKSHDSKHMFVPLKQFTSESMT